MSDADTDLPTEAAPLAALAEQEAYDDLEAAWLEALESDAVPPSACVAVLRILAEKEAARPLESLAWYLLSETLERQGPAEARDLARWCADLLPDRPTLRDQAAEVYRTACADAEGIEILVSMTFGKADMPLEGAVEQIEKLLALPPGTYVRDPRRKSPGRVVRVDPDRPGLEVSFGESGKTYDARGVDALEKLPANDFTAVMAFDADRLAALAESDPAELVRRVLVSAGPRMPYDDLRRALAPIIPRGAWPKWWKSTLPALKRSPQLEMTGGTKPELILRDRPLAFEDQVRRDFEATEEPVGRLDAVLAHLAEHGEESEGERAALAYFDETLTRMAEGPAGLDEALSLAIRAVRAAVRQRLGEEPEEGDPVPDPDRVATLADAFLSDRIVRTILEFVRRRSDEWPETYAQTLPGASQAVAEWIADALADAGHDARLAEAAREAPARPTEAPGALVWLWKAATGPVATVELDASEQVALAIALLNVADALARSDETTGPMARTAASDVQRVLSARDYAALATVVKDTEVGQGRALRIATERNAGLTDMARMKVLELLRAAHPSLYAEKVLPAWEEDILYTTEEAFRERREKLDELIRVKLPANSKAIGDAAAHGDLSENAEWTAALEERDRLTERANSMQEGLAKARVMRPGMGGGDTVSVGSAVTARNRVTGQEERLLFLGPWDSDVEKGVYYYRTPLGLAFMGKSVGDTVELALGGEERSWEITGIESAV